MTTVRRQPGVHPTRRPAGEQCRVAVGGAALLALACSGEPSGVSRPPVPEIVAAIVAANAHNVLSAVVVPVVRHADSVLLRYSLATGGDGAELTTPAITVDGGSARIPVLGMLPERSYRLQVVAYGAGGSTTGAPLSFTTGALPIGLPRYVASGTAPSPGFVAFASGQYALVIDNSGRVVWYRHFPAGAGLSFLAGPDGHYVLRPVTPATGDIEPWIELDPLGDATRSLGCAGGLQSRLHDILLDPDGSYLILCDETRTMDLSALGGVADARVTGTALQRVAADGALLFQWSPFDHFDLADLPASERSGTSVNWTHGNALDRDTDGNILLSFRTLGEITKIDARTGEVIWRLGGPRNAFTFSGTPAPAFARQHGLRVASPGIIVLLDNTGDPRESRAERYVLDERTRTALLLQSYGSRPGVVTEIGGSVQPLAGGRTLVSFGTAGRVEEFDAAGQVVWRIEGHAGYVFRAQRIASLYAPGSGTPR
jgi:hypothetical protein